MNAFEFMIMLLITVGVFALTWWKPADFTIFLYIWIGYVFGKA